MKYIRPGIVATFRILWPHLIDDLPRPTNMAIADGEYWIPTIDEVNFFLKNTTIDRYQYHSKGFDCDDFAYVLAGQVRQNRYYQMKVRGLPPEEWLQWPFGMVWGSKFHGKSMYHAINICIVMDEKDHRKVVLIEPQSDKNWMADKNDDHPYFICM